MKAVVYDRYGPPDVLRIEDVTEPVPASDEVLIRIRATGVTRGDTHLRSGRPLVSRVQSGLRRPKRRILGHELAGEVEAVGAAVTEFAAGDRVFGALPSFALGTGAHAEYMCVPERFPLAHVPAGMSFEQAGGVGDGALLALNCLRPAGGLAGKRILVYGAARARSRRAASTCRRTDLRTSPCGSCTSGSATRRSCSSCLPECARRTSSF
jgi:NADPH:quinone reductase-like Zn-dependent oxidoreductase